jgi:hypothetical protein
VKTLALVFQIVVIINGPDAAVEQPEEIYFYDLDKCLVISERLRDQRNKAHYRNTKGMVGAYCKPAYVFIEEKQTLIWN